MAHKKKSKYVSIKATKETRKKLKVASAKRGISMLKYLEELIKK